MSAGCAMRTMNQQLATSFRCARRTLHGFIELIRDSLVWCYGPALRAGFFYPGKFPGASCSVGHLQTVITDRFDRADRRCQTDCHALSDAEIVPDRPGFGLGKNNKTLACKALRIIYGMEVALFHTDVVRRITNTA